ncbi:MAG: tetratricopeptide repeat protein [Leptolyngbyaceae cyanobacterium]
MNRLKLTLSALSGVIALVSWPTVAIAGPQIHSIEDGTVQVRRQDSGIYIYGRSRMPLEPRDALLPSQGARVRVTCPNGVRQPVTPGRLSGVMVICPDLARSLDGRDDDDLLQLLAGQVPYSPQVWREMPTFIWPDVSPEATYQVAMTQTIFVEAESSDPFAIPTTESRDTVIYEATVTASRCHFDGPPLEAAVRDQLQVTTANVWNYQAAFQQLAETTAADLTTDVEALLALGLEPVDEALALAYLYRDAELYWEVITLLQPLVAQETVPAILHQLLAESYSKTGSVGLAETHYGAAVTLAQAGEDTRTMAEAWVGLAKVAAAQQQHELTAQRLATAQPLYAELAVDEGWVTMIDDWLSKIQQESNTTP